MGCARCRHTERTSRTFEETRRQELFGVLATLRAQCVMNPSLRIERGDDGSHQVSGDLSRANVPSLKNISRVLQCMEQQAGLHEEANLIIIGHAEEASVFARTDGSGEGVIVTTLRRVAWMLRGGARPKRGVTHRLLFDA